MTRAEKEAEARRLRDAGLLLREIAERMGAAVSTVDAWLNDPGGRRLAARKDSYRGVCTECGGQTDGSAGLDHAPDRCVNCIRWTREQVLTAFEEYAEANGGLPPVSYRREPGMPHEGTVRALFGSWNAALLTAGFHLRRDTRPETQEAIEAALRRGDRVTDIAERFGVTPTAIYQRLQVRGIRMADLRQEANSAS